MLVAVTAGTGFVAEAVGTATGYPFGDYAYADRLGPHAARRPAGHPAGLDDDGLPLPAGRAGAALGPAGRRAGRWLGAGRLGPVPRPADGRGRPLALRRRPRVRCPARRTSRCPTTWAGCSSPCSWSARCSCSPAGRRRPAAGRPVPVDLRRLGAGQRRLRGPPASPRSSAASAWASWLSRTPCRCAREAARPGRRRPVGARRRERPAAPRADRPHDRPAGQRPAPAPRRGRAGRALPARAARPDRRRRRAGRAGRRLERRHRRRRAPGGRRRPPAAPAHRPAAARRAGSASRTPAPSWPPPPPPAARCWSSSTPTSSWRRTRSPPPSRLLDEAGLDLVSPYPRQEAPGATRLVQPLLQWSWLTFLPLRLAERSPRPSLSAANGQLLAVRRDAYDRVGGHAAVHDAWSRTSRCCAPSSASGGTRRRRRRHRAGHHPDVRHLGRAGRGLHQVAAHRAGRRRGPARPAVRRARASPPCAAPGPAPWRTPRGSPDAP